MNKDGLSPARSEVLVRTATAAELPQVVRIEQTCFDDPWPAADFQLLLEDPCCSLLVAVTEAEEYVGFSASRLQTPVMALLNLAVLPAWRRSGYGSRLLEAVCSEASRSHCRWLTLEVRRSNHAAVNLYQQAGFAQVNVIRNYYPDGEAALQMVLALSGYRKGVQP